MYLYIATAPVYAILGIFKLGFTSEPYGRHSTYQTGCPPGLTPSHDIEYITIWKIDAQTRDEGFDYEDILHNQFLKYRMMRDKPGDTEWFDFKGQSGITHVKAFMEKMSWVKREVPLSEITPPKRISHQLRKQHHKNKYLLRSITKRNELLNQVQQPIIDAIIAFIQSIVLFAGYVIAPCGSGKTIMTCRGLKGVQKAIICCPSNQIQEQWASTLISESVFTSKQILIMGIGGTTDRNTIKKFMQKDIYCIITTYMSSNILVELLEESPPQILVLDEAHHLAGVVGKEDEGEGKTRRLMMKASELNVKRLSLTFTPRFIKNTDEIETEYLTMDDESMFGTKIAELKIRDLIRLGILPDYRLWSLRDETKKGTGLTGKAECIVEAWNAKEVVRGEEQFILHHLIVFASTNDEAKQLETYFSNKTTDTLVLCVKGGDKLEEPLRKFSTAKRSIIVNCKVLGEGVDIPVANAVAVTYPKKSQGEITQMLLRAGRWYEGKPVFHILLPILDDDDMSGFEEVLTSLASCDEYIRDEIILRASSEKKDTEITERFEEDGGAIPECIMIEDYDGSNLEEIKKCFTNARKNLFPSKESKRIQLLCIEKGIDTSVEYSMTLRTQNPDLPEDPKPKNQLWYDYLHPTLIERITLQEFVKVILEPNNLRVAYRYEEWRGVQPSDVKGRLPSDQHITDGFFGKDYTNFNEILLKFGKKVVGRGR
ncbi:MAG: DEAD/DEAH box helicase [Actinobacteria bacterium]|nr:DEAD/DEAH box helicase [Actinomycetota bacterium]